MNGQGTLNVGSTQDTPEHERRRQERRAFIQLAKEFPNQVIGREIIVMEELWEQEFTIIGYDEERKEE
jgi:hypothetical protein